MNWRYPTIFDKQNEELIKKELKKNPHRESGRKNSYNRIINEAVKQYFQK